MSKKRMTWWELSDYLSNNHNAKGVVVFKNGSYWKKKYPLKERSYLVYGDSKYFNGSMCGSSIFSHTLANTDMGVRLDWYMWGNGKDNWQVDYCYLVEE